MGGGGLPAGKGAIGGGGGLPAGKGGLSQGGHRWGVGVCRRGRGP